MDVPSFRVFVSSVIEGFSQYREGARKAITSVGAQPVLVNEDFPSLPTSPRNACLDGVYSADICIAILGKRAGWTAPSGKPVVEEEIEAAAGRKLPVIVFVERGIDDPDAADLVDRLSHYIEGQFRQEFSGTDELERQIVKALQPLLPVPVAVMRNFTIFDKAFKDLKGDQSQTDLRLVVVPERQEEIVDPARLESPEFKNLIYEIGHDPSIGLFDYEFSKEATVVADTLRVEQEGSSKARRETKNVRLQISEAGEVLLDVNVTGRYAIDRHTRGFGIGSLSVDEEDIEALLRVGLHFVGAVFERLDPFKRQQRFYYNAALIGLGYRTLVRAGAERRGSSMGVMRPDTAMVAYDEPRVILRKDLSESDSEVQRALTVIGRRVSS